MLRRRRSERGEHRVGRGDVGLVDVDDDELWHQREEPVAADEALLVRLDVEIAKRRLGLERGFIRAEVIRWDELLKAGSEANARKQGLLRTEGKSYVVQDGETVNVLFNV